MRLLFLTLFNVIICWNVTAQNIKKEDYFIVDSLAQNAGAMEGASLKLIADSLSYSCKTELQITRAFYYWQTHFIKFDNRRKLNPQNNIDNASSALMERMAASKGMAQMFKALCSVKSIKCEVVKGFLRYRPRDIGHFDKSEIHYWNIVTIGNTKFLIDVALGIGPMDERGRIKTQEYTDAWWLCNRKLFCCSHFPEQPSSQLLESPITQSEFSKAPLVFAGAIIGGLIPTKMLSAVVKMREADTLRLKFNFVAGIAIGSVKLRFDNEALQDANFDLDEFGFYLLLPASKPGNHIVSVFLNEKLSFVFKTRVQKNPKF